MGPLCELLMAAAYSDKEFHEREKDVIVKRLTDLSGEELSPELNATIEAFDRNGFDLEMTCAVFVNDPESEKRNLLELIAAVHDADEVYDFAEDDFLRSVAKALKLDDTALKGLAIDYKVEALSKKLTSVSTPPAVPKR